MEHKDHLREAIRLAADHSADGRNGPFGALLVRNGVVVGRGWNRVVELADPTAHAEIMAIRDACRRMGTHDLSGCLIYSSCAPCPMCLSAIYWARIPTVFFASSAEDAAATGFDDTRILEELGRGWEEREVGGVQELREEGQKVMDAWVENPEKRPY